jgi:hypothetical protein
MGKGSTRRPEAKPGAFAEGWERTFGQVWRVVDIDTEKPSITLELERASAIRE